MTQEILDCWNQAAELQSDRARLIVWLECLRAEINYNKTIEFLELLISTKALRVEEKLLLYWQISGMLFTCKDVPMDLTCKRLKLWRHMSDCYSDNFPHLEMIKNRRTDVVLVTVQQFLSMTHGPTKTVLDRAYILTQMGKKVFILNTAELYGGSMVDVNQPMRASYLPYLSQYDELEYLGVKLPYIQFKNDMPNVQGTQMFLEYLEELRPSYIVNVGGESLTLDCAAKIVPVLNINTVPSTIVPSLATKQVIGRKVNKEDCLLLNCLGLRQDSVIESRFTSSLNQQKRKYSREDLSIPKHCFAIVVVGGRLTQEVDLEFIKMMESALIAGGHLVIVGKMDNYEELCGSSLVLKEHSIYLGMQSDVLAILECCDLYVNPKRLGGGTSVIEAMYKGLPVVTLNYGDVSLGAGADFCVSDYEEMNKTISHYMTDTKYYAEMSQKAKKRAEFMLDSKQAFAELMIKFEKQVSSTMGTEASEPGAEPWGR